MKHEKGVTHLGDHGTKSPTKRQDEYARKYTGAHGTKTTGGPWIESPGQGGGVSDRATYNMDHRGKIKGSNKVAP